MKNKLHKKIISRNLKEMAAEACWQKRKRKEEFISYIFCWFESFEKKNNNEKV